MAAVESAKRGMEILEALLVIEQYGFDGHDERVRFRSRRGSTIIVVMSAEVSYIEIGTGESGRTRAFLEELFEWDFHPMGSGGNDWFETPAMKAGLHGGDANPGILVFFSVADLEVAAARVRDLGGEAEVPSAEEPGFGRFCMCRDPQGVPFGLHRR